jgi:serine/threonine protein phosphatase PrpC
MDDPGPKPLDDEIDVYGLTHVGKVREQNEDHFVFGALRKQIDIHGSSIPDLDRLPVQGERLAYFGLVADGVGGHEGGEEASRTAVETVIRYLNHGMSCYYTADPDQEEHFLDHLRGSVLACHASVLAEAERSNRMMATTLTMVLAIWPRAYVVQIGDSRCYRLRGGTLTQITRDQTVAQELSDEGFSSVNPKLRHVLTSAIGGPEALPVFTRLEFRRDDVFMVCSDGLADRVPKETIRSRLLEMEDSKGACRVLVDDALAAGGVDNITVLVGRVVPPAELEAKRRA